MARGWRQSFELAPTANWDLTVVRTFLLDPVNGDDANQGWSDGAGPYNPATQAKKTFAGLKLVLPVAFAGRVFRIIMAAGAYASGLDVLIGGITGYGVNSLIRGTATNATAGTTAFSDDAADRLYQGWVTATGMNPAGYVPTGAPTTTVVQCLKAAGGAPAFGAEPALPLGARIRFDSTTTTAALRNVCRAVAGVSGTDTITVDVALPAVPVGSDTFYIEIGGLDFPGHALNFGSIGQSGAFQICGLTSAGNMTVNGADVRAVGWKVGSVIYTACAVGEVPAFTEPTTLASVSIGGCMRSEGLTRYLTCGISTLSSHLHLATSTIGPFTSSPLIFSNFIAAASVSFSETGTQIFFSGGRIIGGGSGIAGIVASGRFNIGPVSITGMGAKPCIRIQQGSVGVVIFNGLVSGSAGNTDVGMDVSPTRGCTVYLTTVPTVTGTAGDVRVAGGTIITWAQAAAGFIDANGNQFIGAATEVARPTSLPGLLIARSVSVDLLVPSTIDIPIPDIGGGKLFHLLQIRMEVESQTGTGATVNLAANVLINGGAVFQAISTISPGLTLNGTTLRPMSATMATSPLPVVDPSVANCLQFQLTTPWSGGSVTAIQGRMVAFGYYA